MRFVHTSDWHLGRTFHGADLRPAQEAFLDHLVSWLEEHPVDAVLIAGDVYDRALPAPDMIDLLDSSIDRILATGTPVVMSSGNHDSGPRLGYGRHRFALAGLHLRTRIADIAAPVRLDTAEGPVEIFGVPYLEPGLCWRELGAERRSHHAVMERALQQIAEARTPGVPAIVLAHAFVTGASPSESERDISIGGVGNVGAEVFAGIDYAALGHLHRPQDIGERIRYSGAPVPYSFSEADAENSFTVVDLGAGAPSITTVPVPRQREIAVLEGTLEQLLSDPDLRAREDAFVSARLADAQRVPQAMSRLRARFPHIVHLEWTSLDLPRGEAPAARRGQSDEDIFRRYMDHVTGAPASAEQIDDFAQALLEGRPA